MTSFKSLSLSVVAFLLLIHYFTYITLLYAVTVTSDLEHLQCIAYDVMKLYAKFERNRAIRCGVIVISLFNLDGVYLEHVLRVALGSGIIFTKFDLQQLIRA